MNVADLDQEGFDTPAVWAVAQLEEHGIAAVRLTPGDATKYRLHITRPRTVWCREGVIPGRSADWVTVQVLNSWGASPSAFNLATPITSEYCQRLLDEKDNYTAAVLARFLGTLADRWMARNRDT